VDHGEPVGSFAVRHGREDRELRFLLRQCRARHLGHARLALWRLNRQRFNPFGALAAPRAKTQGFVTLCDRMRKPRSVASPNDAPLHAPAFKLRFNWLLPLDSRVPCLLDARCLSGPLTRAEWRGLLEIVLGVLLVAVLDALGFAVFKWREAHMLLPVRDFLHENTALRRQRFRPASSLRSLGNRTIACC
jgi:hypothetical protein